VVCAILMPLSSVTVVAFACGAATWFGRGIGGVPITASQGGTEILPSQAMLGASIAAEAQP
jgi:hypothetical protein